MSLFFENRHGWYTLCLQGIEEFFIINIYISVDFLLKNRGGVVKEKEEVHTPLVFGIHFDIPTSSYKLGCTCVV